MSTKSKEFPALRTLLVGAALAGIASGTNANAAGLGGAFQAHAAAGTFTPVRGAPATPIAGTPAKPAAGLGAEARCRRWGCRRLCRRFCRYFATS